MHLPVAVLFVRGPDLTIELVNPTYQALAPGKKMLGRRFVEVWPEISPHITRKFLQVLETGESYVETDAFIPIRRNEEGPLEDAWFSWSLHRVSLGEGEGFGVLNTAWETTDRKRSEDALRTANERLDLAQRASGSGIWDWDMSMEALDWSPSLYRLFGLEPRDANATYEMWIDLLHPDDREMAEERIKAAIRDRTSLMNEYRIVRPDGEVRWIYALGQTMCDEHGKPVRMIGICIDITERRHLEEEIREAAWRFRTVADFTYDWEYWRGSRGNVIYMTPSCERITGYTAAEFQEDPGLLTRIVHPDDRSEIAPHLSEVPDDSGPFNRDFRIVRRDGQERWIGHCCQPVYSEEGAFIGRRVSNRDITERKAAEKRLQEYMVNLERIIHQRTSEIDRARADLVASANLASMGRAGAAITHQLSNRVTSGLTLAESLCDEHEASTREGGIAREFCRIFASMRETIGAMRSLFGMTASERQVRVQTDVNEILKNLVALVKPESEKGRIEIVCELDARAPRIESRSGELEQVFLNLINNAIDAMPQGGKLLIRTEGLGDDGMQVAIRDTGKGIPSEIRERIFEPFFTTAEQGQGMGMGLSIARQIVQRHGGEIAFESEPGRGTTFTVRLVAQGG